MQDFSLGHRIRELRLTKGMRQTELAKGICTPSMISQIESDRARPSYKVLAGIAERLEVSVEKLLSSVGLDLESESLYKMAQAMTSSGEFAPAIPLLVQLAECPTYKVPHADLLLLLGKCYLNTKEFSKAECTLEDAFQAASEKQEKHLIAQALHQLGLLYLLMKKHHLAVFQLEKSLDHAHKTDVQDPVLLSKIWVDLGQAHLRMGKSDRALKCFEEGAGLMKEMQNSRDLADLYLQMGRVYRSNEKHEKAAECADFATALYNGLDHVTLKLKIECEAAVIRNGCENTNDGSVMETLRTSIAQFLELREKNLAGEACLELAKFHLTRGETEDAVGSVEQARLLLPETALFRGRVFFLKGRITAENGDVGEAVRCYEKAVGFLKETDAFREWEAVLSELAELHMAAGNEKIAYHLMHEGYQAAHQTMKARGIYL